MSQTSGTTQDTASAPKASWLPLIIVMMAQVQLSFNAFNVSINGIVKDLGIPATAVGLALTISTFATAGFVLLGARLGARLGMRGRSRSACSSPNWWPSPSRSPRAEPCCSSPRCSRDHRSPSRSIADRDDRPQLPP